MKQMQKNYAIKKLNSKVKDTLYLPSKSDIVVNHQMLIESISNEIIRDGLVLNINLDITSIDQLIENSQNISNNGT